MDKFICQKLEYCGQCGCELPEGSTAYSDGYDEIRCPDCYQNDQIGEIYG